MKIKLKSHVLEAFIFLYHKYFIFIRLFCVLIVFHHFSVLISASDVSKI